MKTTSMLAPTWAVMAGWGAGLIAIALGAGALSAENTGFRVIGVALITSGVVIIAWGAVTLARGHIIVPRVGIAVAVGAIILLSAAMMVAPTQISVLSVATASLLLVIGGGACALTVRRAARGTRSEAAPGSSRTILGVLSGAVVVAALVTPALAATEAGQLAPDHSEHSFVNEHQH